MWAVVPTRVLLLKAIFRADGFAAPPLSSRSVSEVVGTSTKEGGSVVVVEVVVVALVEVVLVALVDVVVVAPGRLVEVEVDVEVDVDVVRLVEVVELLEVDDVVP